VQQHCQRRHALREPRQHGERHKPGHLGRGERLPQVPHRVRPPVVVLLRQPGRRPRAGSQAVSGNLQRTLLLAHLNRTPGRTHRQDRSRDATEDVPAVVPLLEGAQNRRRGPPRRVASSASGVVSPCADTLGG
jgi:hypothetical protein